MISFDIISKRFFLKHKGLSDAKVLSITKKEYSFAVNFFWRIYKAFKVNIQSIIKCNLLNLLLAWNLCNKKCIQLSVTSFGILKLDCVMKTREKFSFLPMVNNSVAIGFRFLLVIISAIIPSKNINILHFLVGFYSSLFL